MQNPFYLHESSETTQYNMFSCTFKVTESDQIVSIYISAISLRENLESLFSFQISVFSQINVVYVSVLQIRM